MAQTGKDEIVREGIVDESHGLRRLGVGGRHEGGGELDGLGEDVLGALLFGLGVEVDGLFAVGGGLHDLIMII